MRTLALVLLLVPATLFADSRRIQRTSMGGDIEVDHAPGGAELRTMGGNIRVGRANGELVAKTMGGNIDIRYADGSVDAGSMGGDVRVQVYGSATGRDIQVRSLGGHIEVTFPADFSGTFLVKLEQDYDGDDPPKRIISDFPLQVRESTHRTWFRKRQMLHATGRSGSGANRVEIMTVGSNIVIRKR